MSVPDAEILLPVIDRIYASIEQPELWPQTICAIGEFIGGRRDFWTIHPGDEGPGINPARNSCYPTLFLSRTDLLALDRYAEEFGELITRFLKIVFLSILRSRTDVEAREAIGSQLVQRYLPAFEAVPGSSVAAASVPALRNLLVSLWEEGRAFAAENLHFMRLIAPHLERALRLQMRLDLADLRVETTSGALDCLTLGVVFVDRVGRPLRLNRRAMEITKQSSCLRLSPAGFAGPSPSDTRALRDLIERALRDGTRGVVAIDRGGEMRPLLLIAFPLNPVGGENPPEQLACGVVFISDPDRIDDPTIDSLRQAFGLTHREAQMAIAVAQGHGLRAAAERLGVAVTTARSQLQQAFGKTGTNHQAELAALVHRTLTPVRPT
jgi:DNA-binding CsgD family transcriptional regulator/PAS domain-containing protein